LGVDAEPAPEKGGTPAPAPAAAAAPAPAAPVAPRDLHARVAPAIVGLVVGAEVVPGAAVTASGLTLPTARAVPAAAGGAAALAVVRLGGGAARPSARDFADAVPARVVALSDELDLALVEALPSKSIFYRHLPVARRTPPAGTSVLAAGHDAERGLWAGSV